MTLRPRRFLILGRGRVGRSLARPTQSGEDTFAAGPGRTPSPSAVRAADVLVLAVPDAAIAEVSAHISPLLQSRHRVLHVSGSRSLSDLSECAGAGAATGIMHPMVSFPSLTHCPSLEGTTFIATGAAPAVAAARRIARAHAARCVVAQVHGPAYHAAATMSANGAAAIASASVDVLCRLGLEQRDAERAIGGLLRSVGENVERVGVPAALSGPVRRGDVEAVRKHRAAFTELHAEALSAYDAVLPIILRCAIEGGLPAERARQLRRIIESARSE